MKEPSANTERTVTITHDIGNHAIQAFNFRYIRYEDGSEEFYDQLKDPDEFTNLANNPEYASLKSSLASRLPDNHAQPDPIEDWRRKREFEKTRK